MGRNRRPMNRVAERVDQDEQPRRVDPPAPAKPQRGFHVTGKGKLVADRPSEGATEASPSELIEQGHKIMEHYASLLDQYKELVSQMSQAKYSLAQIRTDYRAAVLGQQERAANPPVDKPEPSPRLKQRMAEEASRNIYRDRGGSTTESVGQAVHR